MSNTVKNMSKLSLFLVGLVVAFNVASCGCKDKDDNKDAKLEVKPGGEVSVKPKFTEATKPSEVKVEGAGFEQSGKMLSDASLLGKDDAIKSGDELEVKLKADANAKDGVVEVKFTKNGKAVAQTIKVTIKK